MKQIEYAKECAKAVDAHKIALATIVGALIREGYNQYEVMKTANAFMDQICEESEIHGSSRGEIIESANSIDMEEMNAGDIPI